VHHLTFILQTKALHNFSENKNGSDTSQNYTQPYTILQHLTTLYNNAFSLPNSPKFTTLYNCYPELSNITKLHTTLQNFPTVLQHCTQLSHNSTQLYKTLKVTQLYNIAQHFTQLFTPQIIQICEALYETLQNFTISDNSTKTWQHITTTLQHLASLQHPTNYKQILQHSTQFHDTLRHFVLQHFTNIL